jgi:hypothetical protein
MSISSAQKDTKESFYPHPRHRNMSLNDQYINIGNENYTKNINNENIVMELLPIYKGKELNGMNKSKENLTEKTFTYEQDDEIKFPMILDYIQNNR